MKYSIGYQLPDEYDSTSELVSDYREHISSVYFSAPGHISARLVIDRKDTEQMLEELSFIKRELNIPLVLLYNANCYGDNAVSDKFKKEIVESLENLDDYSSSLKMVVENIKGDIIKHADAKHAKFK